jgi:hypothetical protein
MRHRLGSNGMLFALRFENINLISAISIGYLKSEREIGLADVGEGLKRKGVRRSFSCLFLCLYKEDRQGPSLPSGKEGDGFRCFRFRYVISV